jgi:YidC/Oxa1 family membrane protein insertase
VPAGLGIYFITSSAWAICERLLLPKIKPVEGSVTVESTADQKTPLNGKGSSKASNSSTLAKVEKPKGKFAQFFDKVLDEARKDSTYRNLVDERDGKVRDKDNDKDRDKDKRGESPRPRPRLR